MISLDDVRTSLYSNEFLSDEIKRDIMQLLIIFNRNFPEINLSIINEKTKNLKVNKGSKFIIKHASFYDIKENTILINVAKLDGSDGKHLLMRELLNVITCAEDFTGFNCNNKYEALNIGYTETLANFLVGNEGVCEFEDEVSAVSMLSLILGDDTFYNAYFSNDISKIFNMIN